jgi:hypothetical protein
MIEFANHISTGAQQAVSVTYFSVTALLLPSNLLMKKISGKRYFPLIMILFGTIVCAISATKNAAGLLTSRFFLGIPGKRISAVTTVYFPANSSSQKLELYQLVSCISLVCSLLP